MPDPSSAFVIMPFANEFDAVFVAISQAIQSAQLVPVRADEQIEPFIVKGIEEGIRSSVVCIADLSHLRPNVLFEVGLAMSMGKPVILITQDRLSDLPFDIRHYRVVQYDTSASGLAGTIQLKW